MYTYILSLFSTIFGSMFRILNRKAGYSTNIHKPVPLKKVNNVWRKVGKLDYSFMYPLLFGIGTYVPKCNLRYNSEAIGCNGGDLIRNHMFLAYDKTSRVVKKGREISYLNEIVITIQDDHTVKLEAFQIESIVLNLKEIRASDVTETCTMSFDEEVSVTVRILDCGEEVAKWLTRYTGKEYLGFGYIVRDERLQQSYAQQYFELSSKDDDEKSTKMFFENIPPLNIMSTSSLMRVKSRPDMPVITPQTMYANIIISTSKEKPFSELEWRYIKIGDAILSNVNRWDINRSQMYEKLEDLPLQMKMEMITLRCEILYPGTTHVDDDVYVLDEEESFE